MTEIDDIWTLDSEGRIILRPTENAWPILARSLWSDAQLGAADGLGLAVTGIKVNAGMLLMAFKVLWLTVVGARVDFCLKPLRHVPETLFVKPSTLILKIAI